jgi:hypothetical protein
MALATAPNKGYLRSTFFARQEREIEILDKLYGFMPIGVEQVFSAEKLGQAFGLSLPVMSRFASDLEEAGILFRRMEYNALIDGERRSGRTFFWTLMVNKADAHKRLIALQEKQQKDYNHPPAPRGTSLKRRVLAAVTTYEKFDTIDELFVKVRRGSENIDRHNLTHVMESLAREGKISFERKSTKERIPYNIRSTKYNKKDVFSKEPVTVEEVVADALPELPEESYMPPTISEGFPLILKLLQRQEWLEKAAKLAEEASEEDIAIMLQERASKPMTAFEAEAVALYKAYMACRESRPLILD